MGETRDPALGRWTVFQGDSASVSIDHLEPLVWPLTFRVFRIDAAGVWEGVDVEVNRELEVAAVKRERLVTRGPDEGLSVVERYDAVLSETRVDLVAALVVCAKCETPLDENGLCGDETCPYSDRPQGEPYTEG